jgi:hypothetical protein
MSEEVFDSLKLTFGDFFKGGYYVGKFKPGTDMIYGSDPKTLKNLGYTKSYISKYGKKSHGKGWALFIENVSYKVRYFDITTEDDVDLPPATSTHDGFNNTYGSDFIYGAATANLMKKVRYKNRSGFIDFYVPSIQEMQFFASKLFDDPTNYYKYLANFHRDDMDNPVFLTSTAFNSDLLYTLYFDINDSFNFGKVNLIPAHTRTRYNVFFMRRIELT